MNHIRSLGVCLALLTGAAVAKEATQSEPPSPSVSRFVLMGGGSSPFNTHVSLEEHIARAVLFLEQRGIDPDRYTVLFANGQADSPIVETTEALPQDDELLHELALALQDSSNRTVTWRPSRLTRIDGPFSRERVESILSQVDSSTRTVFYAAGHGYTGSNGADVSLGVWDQQRISPSDVDRWLRFLPSSHRAIAVMAQCYSGGFAEYIYRGAKARQGISPQDRCGFFASPPDFVSSGCTAEANRSRPDDYSSWFFSALLGQLPDQSPLPLNPDFDGDGRVSFDEAHGFARINDGTLDVPTRSSEFYVRYEASGLDTLEVELTLAGSFDEILRRARPTDRAVMSALAQRLGLASDPAAPLKARFEANRLAEQRERLEQRLSRLHSEESDARNRLRARVLERWPWLVTPYHPAAEPLLRKDRDAIIKLIREAPERDIFDIRYQEATTLEAQVIALNARWARFERLARAAEAVVFEAMVRQKGSRQQREALERILMCEADVP